MVSSIVLKIKRRETPFYDGLYRFIKAIRKGGIPSIPFIHSALYRGIHSVTLLKNTIKSAFYSVPSFRTRTHTCGKGLRLPCGVPWVEGNVRIELGDDVTFYDPTILSGHIHDHPVLRIGNRSTIGYRSIVSVGESVTIGNDVMIAHNCFIADNDGHPIDPERRRKHESVIAEEIMPVVVKDNVWIGANCTILRGVTIGENSVISPNSVVTKDIPPNKIAMGNPARAVFPI